MLAGAAAVSIIPSFWLLAFSMFIVHLSQSGDDQALFRIALIQG
jgi:hypothetical protein